MTSIQTTTPVTTRWSVLPVSAIVFVAAWILGLLIGGPSLGASPTGAEVQAAYRGNALAAAQGILVHGVAGVALAGVGICVAGVLRNAKALVFLACVAALLSLGQLVGELVLVLDPTVAADAAHGWWIALTLLDGAKMIILAVLMLGVAARMRKMDPKRRFFVAVSYATAVAIATSGIGYALMNPTLMTAAYASLPLLLLWVGMAPFAVRR